MKPTVYLDIDGVILANETHAANFADDFIQHVVANYPTKWLTTHVMDGNAATAVERLSGMLKPDTIEVLSKIGGTTWSLAKTEAIDFSEPFLVFEDDLYDDERVALEQHGVLDNWILVDLAKNENQLADFLRSFPIPVNQPPIASDI
jgi:hypothetical protein